MKPLINLTHRAAALLKLIALLSMPLSTTACAQEKSFQQTPGDILIYEDGSEELILYTKDDVVITIYDWDGPDKKIGLLKPTHLNILYSDIHITFCDQKQPSQFTRSQLKDLINGQIESVAFTDETPNKYTLGEDTTIEINGQKKDVIAIKYESEDDQGVNYLDPITRKFLAYDDGETLESIIVGHKKIDQDISKLTDYAYQLCYFGDL